MRAVLFIIVFTFSSIGHSQNMKYIFFEFKQDSIKSRTINACAPANVQTFSINNSIITDYVGNTRVSVLSGLITGKSDTAMALHSLVNGYGNFGVEFEWPFAYLLTRKDANKRDFIGLSFHPRASTIFSNTQTFTNSMVSYDLGLNITGRLTGDLGNISVRYTIRNAVCAGNNRFVIKAFQFSRNEFAYSSFQLKIRTGANIFFISYPLFILSFDGKMENHLPFYTGYTLLF